MSQKFIDQVRTIEQVYFAVATFGSTYSSTQLLFGGGDSEEKQGSKPKLKKT